MKFSCSQQVLTKAFNIVSKAVTSRTTIPILKGILLRVSEDGILTMSASDLDLTIEKKLEVEGAEAGEVVVQAKLFGDIIRKLPNSMIHVSEQNTNLLIQCANSEFNIVGFAADEFPNIKDNEEITDKIVFERDLLNDMIKKTSFAASIDETRGVITGVLVEMKEEELHMVALDGFRMAVAREKIRNAKDKDIIIPAKILNEISKILSESEMEETAVDLYLNPEKSHLPFR